MAISVGIAADLQSESERTGDPVSYGELLALQQGILFQAVPSFAFGLYTNVSALAMLSGIICGLLCDIILVSLVFNDNNPFVLANPSLEKLNTVWAAYIGLALNLIVILIVSLIFHGDKNDDDESETVANKSVTPKQTSQGIHIYFLRRSL